jgi:phosphinothricin acetyltransferase
MGRDYICRVLVRGADPRLDAAACAAVYAPYVESTAISFEETAPDEAELADRIERAHAWLVAEAGGEVAGFAYATEHRRRPAYRWSVEVSVYVAGSHHGEGFGRLLYEALLAELRERGFRAAFAGITLPNEASVALHEKLGFEPIGVYRGIGWKDGAWRDVGWWQLQLDPGADDPPAEPLYH